MKKKIVLVVGARPNFIKASPLINELNKSKNNLEIILIHTGQHYDRELSELFFEQLKMPKPDIYLGVGSGSHAVQTAKIMIAIEKSFLEIKPDLVIVFGDINSTMAASIVASKMCIKIAHVEAGLRSFDKTMPEEINRIITDQLSDYMFVSERSALVNLANEGIDSDKMFFVGNIMIDSLTNNLKEICLSKILTSLLIKPQNYILATFHRPSNVDNIDTLSELLDCLISINQTISVVFPCHPRTKKRIEEFDLMDKIINGGIKIIESLGYMDFMQLQLNAKIILTDSGGIQEESTYLKIPCITIRDSTERPITVDIGSNVLCDLKLISNKVTQILNGQNSFFKVPELWDGQTSKRIVDIIMWKIFN